MGVTNRRREKVQALTAGAERTLVGVGSEGVTNGAERGLVNVKLSALPALNTAAVSVDLQAVRGGTWTTDAQTAALAAGGKSVSFDIATRPFAVRVRITATANCDVTYSALFSR